MNRVLVLAAGNDARGDDAIGPMLLARIEAMGFAHVRTVFDFQFQIEHALDLDEADLVLFVDAHASLAQPVRLEEITCAESPAAGSHALSPAQVLGVHAQVGTHAAPAAFVLAVAGVRFALGEGMSDDALAAVALADDLVHRLLARPQAAFWRENLAV